MKVEGANLTRLENLFPCCNLTQHRANAAHKTHSTVKQAQHAHQAHCPSQLYLLHARNPTKTKACPPYNTKAKLFASAQGHKHSGL